MTEDLRAALGAGDTPAGLDVPAVRARAQRIRRRRTVWATAATAGLAALAIAVPVALVRGGSAPPPGSTPAAPTPAAVRCPDELPDKPQNAGPGLDRALVPFAAETGLICTYDADAQQNGPITGVARLTAAELRSLTVRLRRPSNVEYCTLEGGSPFALQLAGSDRVVTLRLEPYGCVQVTNGTRSQSALDHRDWVIRLRDRVFRATGCPDQLDRDRAVPAGTESPGDTVLPADVRRLLACRYTPAGRLVWRGKTAMTDLRWADPARVVAELNASPPLRPGTACTRDAGPLLVLRAVTSDGVVSAVADGGGCGVVDNGVRQVTAKALIRRLALGP